MRLRIRLLLLPVIAVAPAIALLMWNQADLSEARTREIEQQVIALARQQAAEVDRIAEGALQFLVALAQVQDIRTGDPACEDLLSRIRTNYLSYLALIRADENGTVTCSSIGPGPTIQDRLYFRTAIDTNAFAVGEYVQGRGTRNSSFHFAYPIRDDSGQATAVIAAALSLQWFAERLQEKMPPGFTLHVVDRNGTILVAVPDDRGKMGTKIDDEYRRIISAAQPGIARVTDIDGQPQVLGYATTYGIHVAVARDLASAFTDLHRAQLRGAVLVALGLLTSLLLAGLWGEYGIRRPIAALHDLVQRWRGGDYVQSGRTWDASELGHVGAAFDELAETVLERERRLTDSEARLQEHRKYLSTVLDRVPAGIMQIRPDGVYAFVNTKFCEIVGRSRSELIGENFEKITHPDDIAGDRATFDKAVTERRSYTHRKRYARKDGTTVWGENTVTHLDDGQGILAVCLPLRERMEAEERQQRLINELNHRVKNTLATVQALLTMSIRNNASPEALLEAFTARIKALSTTHNLLTDGLWQMVSLPDLVRAELEPYAGGRITVDGPPTDLTPREAISLGMVFHELATNAAKYGALSQQKGAVSVHWTAPSDAQGTHRVEWREFGGPRVEPSSRRGFGSRLIELSIADLGGSSEVRFEPTGLVCVMNVPLSRSEPLVQQAATPVGASA